MKSLRVSNYMSRSLVTFRPNQNVVEAIDLLLANRISGAPVTDKNGKLLGIVSELDLLQVIVQDSYYKEPIGIVGDYMHREVNTIRPDMDIYELAEKFIREGRRRYPVVKNACLLGQISRRDILYAAKGILSPK